MTIIISTDKSALWPNVVKWSRFYPTWNAQVSWSNNHSLKLCPFNCSNTPVSNCSPSFIDSSHWLTHCGLVTLYSYRHLGQHWFRWWLVAWRLPNPCWLIASKVQWHSSEGNVTRDKLAIKTLTIKKLLENYIKFPRDNELKPEIAILLLLWWGLEQRDILLWLKYSQINTQLHAEWQWWIQNTFKTLNNRNPISRP